MSGLEVITLDHDELEALVLCDEQELNQEAAGVQMGVSRGTVQRLLASGRRKVVGALAAGKALSITPVRHAVPTVESDGLCCDQSSSCASERSWVE
jgi:predicted DNA-binding protein (UPF0251 family)